MEATGCIETLVPINQTTRRYIPESKIFKDGSRIRGSLRCVTKGHGKGALEEETTISTNYLIYWISGAHSWVIFYSGRIGALIFIFKSAVARHYRQAS
jgi:hypothetical protein